MSKYFSTIGLRAVDLRRHRQHWQLVRFEGEMQKDGSYTIRAVSGHNLAPLNRKPVRLSAVAFEALPPDYHNIARWDAIAALFGYSRCVEDWQDRWL